MKDFVVLFLVALGVTSLINGLNISFSDPNEQTQAKQITGLQTSTPTQSGGQYQNEQEQ
jgi:hypothetical protein